MRLARILVAAAFASLSACAPWQEVRLTGRDHASGWPDQIRKAAVEAYAYAQMAANAREDQGRFDLGPHTRMIWGGGNSYQGYAYWIFERRTGDRLEEVILAFTGTKPVRPRGWEHVDMIALRNRGVLETYDRQRAETDPAVPITVIGDALGGEIASYVVSRRPGARSYVFNWSPPLPTHGSVPDNQRLTIVDRGEGSRVVRLPGKGAPQTFVSIDCRRGRNALDEAGIRILAECLTRIAAFDSAEARASLSRNRIGRPPGLPRS